MSYIQRRNIISRIFKRMSWIGGRTQDSGASVDGIAKAPDYKGEKQFLLVAQATGLPGLQDNSMFRYEI
ncbi:hypothetical protein [Sulfuricaulis limicola]|uniref:hypothetical protein n=1 Tax=Sulfuricaulis limicola TaxID=1620215 RepID=UPI000BBAD45E|nr:hypothetical protein [Sulfuricaulis limicola]